MSRTVVVVGTAIAPGEELVAFAVEKPYVLDAHTTSTVPRLARAPCFILGKEREPSSLAPHHISRVASEYMHAAAVTRPTHGTLLYVV